MEKRRCTVNISGIELNIVTDESDEYVSELARMLSERVDALTVTAKCSRVEAAMLCALDYLDVTAKTKFALSESEEKINELEGEIDTLRRQLDNLREKYLRG